MRTKMNLPKKLIEEYKNGAKIICLSKTYNIEYNVLYFKIGELGIRRKERKGGYRGGYKRNYSKLQETEWSLELKAVMKRNTEVNNKHFAKQMRPTMWEDFKCINIQK